MVMYLFLFLTLLIVSSLIYVFINIKIVKPLEKQIEELKAALESKREADKKRDEDKTEPGRHDPDESLVNNLVVKTKKTRMGRSLCEYKLSEKMPEFNTLDESIGFGLGLSTEINDPTILNLSPYGSVMKSDYFFAFKLVMQNIFQQIKGLTQKA